MILHFNCGKHDTESRKEAAVGDRMTANDRWREVSETVAQMEQRSFADAWTEAMVADSLRQSYNHLWMAVDDDCTDCAAIVDAGAAGAGGKPPCGYLLANVLGDETELLRVAVNPDDRMRGMGQALMDAYLMYVRTCASRGLLEVRHGNEAAKRLYERNGYRLLASRKNYYKHPEEDADIYEIVFTENGE